MERALTPLLDKWLHSAFAHSTNNGKTRAEYGRKCRCGSQLQMHGKISWVDNFVFPTNGTSKKNLSWNGLENETAT